MTRYLLYLLISYLTISFIQIVYLYIKNNSKGLSVDFKYMPWEHLNTISYKSNLFKELELSILYRSGIKNIIPFITLSGFLAFNLLFSLSSFIIFYVYINLFLPSVVLASIIFIIPLTVLNIMEQIRNDIVSKELARFISIISRWSIVKDDIFYCFEKAIDQVENPIKSYIKDFLMNVKYTGNISFAFDILLIQSNNELYRNFVINIRQAERSKGDLALLLDHLEEEAYKIEAENSRRKSVTLKDRTVIYITMICVLLIGICVLRFNDNIRLFYLSSVVGRYLLTLYLILFFLGVHVTSKITSFDY